MLYLRRILPLTGGLLFLALFLIPYLHFRQSIPEQTALVLMITAAGLGCLCGFLLDRHIHKKMEPESYRRLVHTVLAVLVLLVLLCGLAEYLR